MGLCYTITAPEQQELPGSGLAVLLSLNTLDAWQQWINTAKGVKVKLAEKASPNMLTQMLVAPFQMASIALRSTYFDLQVEMSANAL